MIACWYCKQEGKETPAIRGKDGTCKACQRRCCAAHMLSGRLCRQHGTGPSVARAEVTVFVRDHVQFIHVK